MTETAEAQAQISGNVVARMVLDFQREFRASYPHDVMVSNLCAVGPLHSMIGLAIKNGHLPAQTKPPKCTSWFGHQFRPRYSTKPFTTKNAELQALALVNKDIVKTYHHDVCVRCGFVVERKTPEKPTN